MNDIDELKARSIELAERAFRLRDRANDDETKEKLHAAGNELVAISNRQRFYDSQRMLEEGEMWSEDQRAFAHELNSADRTLRGANIVAFADALHYLEEWYGLVIANPPVDSAQLMETLGESIRTLQVSNDGVRCKKALNFLLTYIEEVLQYAHKIQDIQNESADPAVLALRDIRDSLLVHRELIFDEEELVETFQDEGDKIERLGLARHQLDELYRAVKS